MTNQQHPDRVMHLLMEEVVRANRGGDSIKLARMGDIDRSLCREDSRQGHTAWKIAHRDEDYSLLEKWVMDNERGSFLSDEDSDFADI